jgi:MFS family permease
VNPPGRWLPRLTSDGWLLFATYSLRLAAYAWVAVILGLYLAALGFEASAIGLVFTAAVGGGGVMTASLSWLADRWGRRRVLVIGALLMAAAGAVFATSTNRIVLIMAAAVGTLSPSGSEVGPFLSIEQAMLPQTTSADDRTKAFSAYNVVGQGIGAAGAAAAAVPALLGAEPVTGYRTLMWAYAVTGLFLAVLFARLSDRIEVKGPREKTAGGFASGPARGTILKFTGLYALDSLGSGFVVQSLVFYWFNQRYGIDVKGLGAIAVGTDVLAAASFLAAPWVAAHVGLLLAAILPHVIANVLVIAVPLMPTWQLAVGTWLARYAFAQMERPARQSYTMAILPEEQRAGASGVMSVARNIAAAVAPGLSGALLSNAALGLPFLAAGTIKLIYDGALFIMFRGVHPPEERNRRG